MERGGGGHGRALGLHESSSELDAKGTASYSIGAIAFCPGRIGETVLFHFLLKSFGAHLFTGSWNNGRKTRGLRNALLILEGGW